MNRTPNVTKMTETAGECFDAADKIVTEMADGSRIQIKDLATKVSAEVGMEAKRVLGFINHYVHATDIAYVTRGKKGGLIKGVRPAKVVKTPRVKKISAPADITQ